MFVHNYHALKFEKNLQILTFLFQFLNSKLGYLMNCMTTKFFGLLYYSQHRTCVKNLILIAFILLKLLYIKIWKNLQILTFLCFFSIFGLKIKVFDEVYDYLNLLFLFKSLEWLFFIKLWWQKKIIFLQMNNTILQRVK